MSKKGFPHLTPKVVVGLMLVLSIICCNVTFANPQQEPESYASVRGATPTSSTTLTNHGGSISQANTTFVIYWIPAGYSVSARYQSLINGFLQNVAKDSGKSSNVYYSSIQYGAPYSTTFGSAIVDTSPFPANGCNNPTTSICLTDAQIQSELTSVMTAQGWTGGIGKIYFMLTPKNVGSCSNSTNLNCSYVQYCADHNYIGNNTNPVLYAHIPYAAWSIGKCGSWQHPNGDDADSTINIVSHEHNEIVTDPLHNAWFDSDNKERSDKCAWNFGTPLGWTVYARYNQVINGQKYYVQSEWSNQTSRCVLTGL